MSLPSGSRIGAYEIVAPLGAGGMGEVYRATDRHLKRSVAIKVLPAAVAGDVDRLARFQREAEVLGALNHPNIAAIYGLEKTPDVTALVMELVEGEDLTAHIARGAIPLAEALPMARQIADALEAAHEQGIVHRDLKPQNIKVRADGTVKVLDFGLAKAMDPAAAPSADAMNSPTLTNRATQMGLIIGTAAYMAPEQAKGKAVDKRADIWAFGVIVLEMVTGERLFAAETIGESIAAVLTREPDWSRVPMGVRPLVQACLQKDPRKRLRDIGDMSLLLASAPNAPAPVRRRSVWPWIAAALVAGAGVTAVVASAWRPAPVLAPFAFHEPAPNGTSLFAPVRMSPDRQHLALIARSADGQRRIWTRALAEEDARPVDGTEGATLVFWSPDAADLGFVADGEVRRIPLTGGRPTYVSAHAATTAVWTPDGEIILAGPFGMVRVKAAGGTPRPLLTDRPGTHSDLTLLPPGRQMLFRQFGGETGLYALNLSDEKVRRLEWDVDAVSGGLGFVAPDVLYYRRQQGIVVGRRLDVTSLAPVGEEFAIAEDVRSFASGDAGAISFIPGTTLERLTWRDRAGRPLGTVGSEADYNEVHLSRSGRWLLFNATDPTTGNVDLWIQELKASVADRLTVDPGIDHNAAFSPDENEVVWEGHRGQSLSVFRRRRDGSDDARLERRWDRGGGPNDWSPDGKFVVYTSREIKTQGDLWVVPMQDKTEPSLLVATEFDESDGMISPDGRWLAYVSNATGRNEVYLQRLDVSRRVGGPQRVSSNGGSEPAWRRDGTELFYVSNGSLAVVKTALDTERPAGTSETLFQLAESTALNRYAVSPDGQRFLVIEGGRETNSLAVLLMNWKAGLGKR